VLFGVRDPSFIRDLSRTNIHHQTTQGRRRRAAACLPLCVCSHLPWFPSWQVFFRSLLDVDSASNQPTCCCSESETAPIVLLLPRRFRAGFCPGPPLRQPRCGAQRLRRRLLNSTAFLLCFHDALFSSVAELSRDHRFATREVFYLTLSTSGSRLTTFSNGGHCSALAAFVARF